MDSAAMLAALCSHSLALPDVSRTITSVPAMDNESQPSSSLITRECVNLILQDVLLAASLIDVPAAVSTADQPADDSGAAGDARDAVSPWSGVSHRCLSSLVCLSPAASDSAGLSALVTGPPGPAAAGVSLQVAHHLTDMEMQPCCSSGDGAESVCSVSLKYLQPLVYSQVGSLLFMAYDHAV